MVLAPAVWLVVLLSRGRWAAAGALLGVATLLKPQGLLLFPVGLFGAWLGAPAVGDMVPRGRRIGIVLATALVVVGTLTLPWTIVDGGHWIERSLVDNLVTLYPHTTMGAFNLWSLVALVGEWWSGARPRDATTIVAGLSLDAWSRAILAIVAVAVAVLCWRQRRRPYALALFAALFLWSACMLPTRVHERYLLYCMPLVIAVAAAAPRFRPAVLALAMIGVAQHGWYLWQYAATSPPPGSADVEDGSFAAAARRAGLVIEGVTDTEPGTVSTPARWTRDRTRRVDTEILEWLLTLAALAMYVDALVAAARGTPDAGKHGRGEVDRIPPDA